VTNPLAPTAELVAAIRLRGHSLTIIRLAQQQPIAKRNLDQAEDLDAKSASHSSSSLEDKESGARRAA
jgi:hypothetical protein